MKSIGGQSQHFGLRHFELRHFILNAGETGGFQRIDLFAKAVCPGFKLGVLEVSHRKARERAAIATLGFDAKSYRGAVLLQQLDAKRLRAERNDDPVAFVGDFLNRWPIGSGKTSLPNNFDDTLDSRICRMGWVIRKTVISIP